MVLGYETFRTPSCCRCCPSYAKWWQWSRQRNVGWDLFWLELSSPFETFLHASTLQVMSVMFSSRKWTDGGPGWGGMCFGSNCLQCFSLTPVCNQWCSVVEKVEIVEEDRQGEMMSFGSGNADHLLSALGRPRDHKSNFPILSHCTASYSNLQLEIQDWLWSQKVSIQKCYK